ncbi:MAG: redoxin family protein [Acidobacteriota bacterium]
MRTHPPSRAERPRRRSGSDRPRAALAPVCLTLSVLIFATAAAAETEGRSDGLTPEALETALIDVTAGEGEGATTLGGRRGAGGLVVVFLSNTCPYVVDWADRIPQLAAQAAERGVGVALVNSNAGKRRATDSPEEMGRFAEKHLGELPYLLDEGAKLADLVGAERTPEAFLYDAELKLVYRGPFDDHSGPFDRVTQPGLRDAVAALAAGVDGPESQPALGCKVQRPRRRATRQ